MLKAVCITFTVLIIVAGIVWIIGYEGGNLTIQNRVTKAVVIKKYWRPARALTFSTAPEGFWLRVRSVEPKEFDVVVPWNKFKYGISWRFQVREEVWDKWKVGDTLYFE